MTDLKCMYCAESGITNTDVFIEIVDVELGAGWICKECFLESEKEKEEHLKELEEELKAKEQECEELNEELYYWVNGEYCDNECNVVKELDQLKAENEELKKNYFTVIQQRNKAEKTLTEIKEIGKNSMREGKMLSGGWLYQFIEQKISEVEND